MLIIDHVLVTDGFLKAMFVCDLPRCKGDCCVKGDAGAPLEPAEIGLIEEQIDQIRPFMRPEGVCVIDELGVFDYDMTGNFVTPLVDGRECAFVGFHDNGMSYCTIEKAWSNGKSELRKPVSCHLYPVRLTEKDGFTHLHYHQWSICVPAVRKGHYQSTPLYVFLREALIRRFGEDRYNKLVAAINAQADAET